jgi:hypothetical protein
MTAQGTLGRIDRTARSRRRLTPVRILLPLGWILAGVGYYGPWIAHKTAALALSGADMGEFVKFLPGFLDGRLQLTRQVFYLAPFAVVMSIALLVGLRRLRYPLPLRALMLVLAVPVSLQMLPPAWSPTSLITAEFRLQTIALAVSWVALAGAWLLGELPPWVAGLLSAALSLTAAGLSAWQFLVVKPGIDEVYRVPPSIGWGFYLCVLSLALVTAGGVILVLRTRSGELWTGE